MVGIVSPIRTQFQHHLPLLFLKLLAWSGRLGCESQTRRISSVTLVPQGNPIDQWSTTPVTNQIRGVTWSEILWVSWAPVFHMRASQHGPGGAKKFTYHQDFLRMFFSCPLAIQRGSGKCHVKKSKVGFGKSSISGLSSHRLEIPERRIEKVHPVYSPIILDSIP